MFTRAIRSSIIGAICIAVSATTVPALSILGGSDLLSTEVGTYFDLTLLGPTPLPPIIVPLEGCPTGPGNTDTVIRRLEDAELPAVGDSDTISIEMVGLSLQSVSPFDVGGIFYDLKIKLSPTSPSTGGMTIDLLDDVNPSGTFTSFFDVFFDVSLINVATGIEDYSFSPSSSLHLEGTGSWTSAPPSGAALVTGAVGDNGANWHTGKSADQHDFFLNGTVTETHPSGAVHVAQTAVVPVPAPAGLILLGMLMVGIRRRFSKCS